MKTLKHALPTLLLWSAVVGFCIVSADWQYVAFWHLSSLIVGAAVQVWIVIASVQDAIRQCEIDEDCLL